MSDPIIPGIDDARAREILSGLASRNAHTSISLEEASAMQAAGLWFADVNYPRLASCRALWERIKTDDR